MKRLSVILFICLFAVSCQGDPGDVIPPGGGNENPVPLTGVDKWIYDELKEWYYWNDAVKAATVPSGSLEYGDFMETLLLDLKGAQDNTENPSTIDGGYYTSGGRYLYSDIDRYDAGATRAEKPEEGIKTTFGFGVEVFLVGGTSTVPRYGFLVTWVLPDGPADKAGIKRGTLFVKYNGADIYYDQYVDFINQLYYLEGGSTMILSAKNGDNGEQGKTYRLTASTMKSSPILKADVVTTAEGAKAAYLVYNEFTPGAGVDKRGGEFDYALRDAFERFKTEGATELVLDLRYNGGGDMNSCLILSSLIGNVSTSDIFLKMLFNDDIALKNRWPNPQVWRFLNEPAGMKLDRVYVLATEYTASASESVINSLRGAGIEVVHIGTRTEGKNVGMTLSETTIGNYSYEMWPITFKSMNAENFCDYAGGFAPDYPKNEFYDIIEGNPGASRTIYELGDTNERLLAAALALIDGKEVQADPETRATDGSFQQVEKRYNPHRGGMRLRELPKPAPVQ